MPPMLCNGRSGDEVRKLLASPFPAEHIDWKPQTAGWKGTGADAKPWVKLIAFIDNRAIQKRLDDVCGIDGWRNEFAPMPGGGMMCGLSIRFESLSGERVEWVTKWDGAPETEIESVKGAISGAMKRAATQWGIGRYLYDVEVKFGRIAPDNDWEAKQVKPKDGKPFRWYPPVLPAWAQFDGSGIPGVSSTIQQARAETAAKALAKEPAGEFVLPGTKSHFHGHGGKRLKDVPTTELQRAMAHLQTIQTEEYTTLIDAIGEVIADRASAGA
jgi:hypothetical protein